MFIKDNELHLVWCTEDIKEYALTDMKESIQLTEKECLDCLGYLLKRHDCEYGTTWLSIENVINDIVEERGLL